MTGCDGTGEQGVAQIPFSEDDARSGGVPNAYRNAVFWKWSRQMPRALPNAVLTMLYALGTAADASGRIRFAGDHQPVRMADIAAAARCDPKDARRYVAALIAAGVLAVQGEQGPGKRPTYILLMSACPDWGAAVASLTGSKRRRTPKTPPPWQQEKAGKSGGPTPEVATDTPDDFGGPAPEHGNGTSGDRPLESGDVAGTDFGGPTPIGLRGTDPRDFGGPAPEQPMSPREVPQEIDEVGDQPAGVARTSRPLKIDFDQLPMGGAAYRTAARMHLARQGVKATPAEVDAYAAELVALDQAEPGPAEEAAPARLSLLHPPLPSARRMPAAAAGYQPPLLQSMGPEAEETTVRAKDGTLTFGREATA